MKIKLQNFQLEMKHTVVEVPEGTLVLVWLVPNSKDTNRDKKYR